MHAWSFCGEGLLVWSGRRQLSGGGHVVVGRGVLSWAAGASRGGWWGTGWLRRGWLGCGFDGSFDERQALGDVFGSWLAALGFVHADVVGGWR